MLRLRASKVASIIGAISLASLASAQDDKFTDASNSCATKYTDAQGFATGLDLSSYQGEVDWASVADQDRHFVFLRAGHGTKKDSRFDEHWSGAAGKCLLRGTYFFFNHSEDATAQAGLFASLAKDARGELEPVIDAEGLNSDDSARICASRTAAKDFESKLGELVAAFTDAYGAQPIIYASPGFWNCLPTNSIPDKSELWVAHYTSAQTPRLPNGWSTWRFWQFSESARVGNLTIDSDRFNGSPKDLLAYAQAHPPASGQ